MNLLVDTELRYLLQAVHHVETLRQHQEHVGIGGARLDKVSGEVGGTERRQLVAGDRAAELSEVGLRRLLQRMAERVVRRDEVPLLAVLVEQQFGNGVGLHLRRVTHAIDVPVAILAGDAVSVATGDNVQHLLLVRHLGDGERDPRIHIADEELDAVAFDQLARLLHASADVIGRVLDQELNFAAEHATLGVDLFDGVFNADQFILRHRGVDAGEWIDHADFDRVGGARRPYKGPGDLGETGDGAGLDHGAAVYAAEVEALGHLFLPERVISAGDFAAAVSARQEAMTSWAPQFAPALDSP